MASVASRVRVGPSNVPDAGDGVFAVAELRENSLLAWYRGERLTAAQFDARYADGKSTHVLQLSCDVYVDASRGGNWTAKINDARGSGDAANVRFTVAGAVRSLRRIHAGEELLLDYGPHFFHAPHAGKRCTAKPRDL